MRRVIEANNEFFRTDNIPEEEKRVNETFLSVVPDAYVERLIKKEWLYRKIFWQNYWGNGGIQIVFWYNV